VLHDLPVTWLQAPQVRYQPWELTRTDCYSQLLGNIGFNEPVKLGSSVSGWTALLKALKPDAALLEFAPSAMVACRILEIPYVLQGNGFFCPPPFADDFGIMQPKMPAAVRRAEDTALLDSVNEVLTRFQGKNLGHISELYAAAQHTILASFVELDHFQRGDTQRFSGVWVPHQSAKAVWPKAGKNISKQAASKRIFAYLNARPGVDKVMNMLSRSGVPTLIFCGELAEKYRKPFMTESCQFLDGLVDMRQLAQEADLGVFHGNHSSSALFLLAGTPTLQLPLYMEQLMFAKRVRALSAGEVVTMDQPNRIAEALTIMLNADVYTNAAASFAEKYRDFDQRTEIHAAADALEAALAL